MKNLASLKVKIFADGADKAGMLQLNTNPLIKGMTTNPSLMRKAGVHDYEAFARDILKSITEKPISFEVFSDEFPEMRRQAMKIKDWARNVYVKIPITNTRAESSLPLVRELAQEGVKLNITAMFTEEQVTGVAKALNPKVPAVVSVFAGRIADVGEDPMPHMRNANKILAGLPEAELLWAVSVKRSTFFKRGESGCKIITAPQDILDKAMKLVGTGLPEMSLDTVKMFAVDAKAAGFSL